MDDSGFLEDTGRLLGLSGSHVQLSKVWKTMMGTCGPYNSGSSATPLHRCERSLELLVCRLANPSLMGGKVPVQGENVKDATAARAMLGADVIGRHSSEGSKGKDGDLP